MTNVPPVKQPVTTPSFAAAAGRARPEPAAGDEHGWARGPDHRMLTGANVITVVRTLAAVALGLAAAGSAGTPAARGLLLASLVTFWVGDVLDGAWARWRGEETRLGGVLDIVCDRACALVFYVGLAWSLPQLSLAIGIYLLEFGVADMILSVAFLSWPLLSPNYFHLVDRRLWQWNWSRPAKALNSSVFAVLLLWTESAWICGFVAVALLAVKCASLLRLVRIGIPVPPMRAP